MRFDKLLFGTPGIPSNAVNTLDGIKKVSALNLDAMELEFVQKVNINKEKAVEVKKLAQEKNVVLTCHGQYFVNLNAKEKEKLEMSNHLILSAAKRAFECSAFSITWHMAFYLKMEKETVYNNVKKMLSIIVKKLQDEGINIWLRPETTGKHSQFGTLEEILRLSSELEQIMPCIDFSHLHARANGKMNSFDEFKQVLSMVESHLGREALNQMHCHVSGINYNEKGERNHLPLKESDMNYMDLLKAFKEFKCKGVVISESPNIEEDALLLKKAYSRIE